MTWLRAWWKRLCEIIAARDPLDITTDWQESDLPTTVWPASAPDELTQPHPEQVK